LTLEIEDSTNKCSDIQSLVFCEAITSIDM